MNKNSAARVCWRRASRTPLVEREREREREREKLTKSICVKTIIKER